MKTEPKEPLNTAIGDRMLCAWRPVPGVVWVQTRDPKHAQRIQTRSDSRRVVTGVAGGYLRTFEFTGKTQAWAKRLLARYTRKDSGPGEAFSPAALDLPLPKMKRDTR